VSQRGLGYFVPLFAYIIVAVCQLANHGADKLFMQMKEQDILEEALSITQGDRQEDYGDCKVELERVAALWSVIFGTTINTNQVALAMVALKITRQLNKNKRDNWVDIAGYARVGYIATKEPKESEKTYSNVKLTKKELNKL